MLFAVLGFASIMLTYSMFQSKSAMLGFPCLIFWVILGGYCYQQSTATWDLYYLTFFGSTFVGVFCAFAAFALRTKKEEAAEGDLYFDEGGDDDVKFIDDGDSYTKTAETEEEDKPRRRTREIRERVNKRRARWE